MTSIEPLLPEHFEQVAGWLSRPETNKWLSGEWRDHEATPSILAIAVRNRRNKLYLVRHESSPCGLVGWPTLIQPTGSPWFGIFWATTD